MRVIVGIGVPGVGKSTYLKPLADAEGYMYVNADDIRQEVNGDASDHSRHLHIMRLFHERVAAALSAGRNVVIDATYSRRKDRVSIIKLCRNHGATEIIGYWFKADVSVAIKRNTDRTRVVPEAAIYAMHHRLRINPPSLDEGFDEIVII